jgi:Helix-turn-helix domain/PIF1-like helicase
MEMQQTEKLELAARFINSTNSHLFLTGKAGTGKTTFLRKLSAETHKNHIVVAPTGIAALNAKGVTIHSQFLFPFGSFLPENEPNGKFTSAPGFYTKHSLTRMHPLNSVRKKVLRATELLIIDEVSMLRADILDAIDFRMRSAKGNYSKSFGGAQVLMIGDLQQLPPIVGDQEWLLLQKYYRSMHFFEALAFREEKMVCVELDKIFRQSDQDFIDILNRLRDMQVTPEDVRRLNSHYRSAEEIENRDDIITIATHNHIADGINRRKLEALAAPSCFFEADISGDFPEKLYPLPLQIELKEGAQVMFIKNDSSEEKRYVNGKLARVERIDGDEILVLMSGSAEEYILKKESWDNKKYALNEESKEVVEIVIGSYEQYPVKLAWAVTVHKSQGLTFERAIIDVGQAFAPGQVYVALSRLKSLDGLVLRTPISSSTLRSDTDVQAFNQQMEQQPSLDGMLHEKQRYYLEEILSTTFDFSLLERQVENLQRFKAGKMEFEDPGMQQAMGKLLKALKDEAPNTVTFRRQLQSLLLQNNPDMLLERIRKGSDYYAAFIERMLKQLLIHLAEVELFTRTKTYRNVLSEIDQQLMIAWRKLEEAEYLARSILSDRDIEKTIGAYKALSEHRNELWEQAQQSALDNPNLSKRKSGRKRKKGAKLEKGETYRITYALIQEGKSIEEIASERKLATSTIEAHALRGIKEGELDIHRLLGEELIEEVSVLLQKSKSSIAEQYKAQKGKYKYIILRMVHAHLAKSRSS